MTNLSQSQKNEIICKAEEYALAEIQAYNSPLEHIWRLSNEKGLLLARKFNADEFIVQLGTRLMDIKLGEAISQNRVKDHVKMGIEATRIFLNQFDIADEDVRKIINCVEGHHKTVPWICKEAEICANADCYRFLQFNSWIRFLMALNDRPGMTFEEKLKFAESKADEKWGILTIEGCRNELEDDYQLIKKVCSRSI